MGAERIIKKEIKKRVRKRIKRRRKKLTKRPTMMLNGEELWDRVVGNYKMKKTDYFKTGKVTILNSEMAALKQAEEFLKDMRKKGRRLFCDPEFGPQHKGDSAVDSIYFEDIPPGYPDAVKIEWCRPGIISTVKMPQFIDDGAGTNDVIQGAIGDCWFIGAMSVLAT